ncbi:MAG: hypothetical protein IPN95_28805 [Bacteroidetes bacterium]|nr:hypothetical protein [Bacteroidota bacterium]
MTLFLDGSGGVEDRFRIHPRRQSYPEAQTFGICLVFFAFELFVLPFSNALFFSFLLNVSCDFAINYFWTQILRTLLEGTFTCPIVAGAKGLFAKVVIFDPFPGF